MKIKKKKVRKMKLMMLNFMILQNLIKNNNQNRLITSAYFNLFKRKIKRLIVVKFLYDY